MKKVVKFGGSSLANAKQFKKTGDIIRSDKNRRYVVPSAPGKRDAKDTKVTDLLYEAYQEAISKRPYSKILSEIKKRYDDIIDGLDINLDLTFEFDKINDNLNKNPNKDYAASRGEYLSGIVMSAYLGYEFIDPADMIVFNDDRTLNSEETNDNIEERLSHIEKAVIPGFYGADRYGNIVTFSRGGSDITGSLIARGIKADMYENWTDVSGFLVTDPHIVNDPKVIDSITYAELRELSYMGAGVLHEDAIFPVRKEGIPINIKNTNKPDDPGTMIVESTCKNPKYTITGIAGKRGFCSINVDKAMMNSEVGFCRKVLGIFEDQGISIEHMPSGIDTMTVIVHQSEFEKCEQQAIAGIHRAVHPDKVEMESGISLIAVVGRGMKSNRGTAARIFAALSHAHINIKMIDQGSSELNIIVGVKDNDFDNAIKAIYDIFITAEL